MLEDASFLTNRVETPHEQQAYKEYLENPPNKKTAFVKEKTADDLEDERIMAMLEEESAKNKAKTEKEAAAQRKVDIEGIAKEWATKEYTLRMLNGDIDESTPEKDFMISVWEEAMTEAAKAYELVNSDEYKQEAEKKSKSLMDVEDKLFWDGMPDILRKKREKMVENVKKQYMDLLSEEELERIILGSD